MRKILTQFICAIIVCCQVLNLVPVTTFAKTNLGTTYKLESEETYEYEFTPDVSGLYICTVSNLGGYGNYHIVLTSDTGYVLAEYWPCYDEDEPTEMYFMLQAGITYTYVHEKESWDESGKHVLKIELDDTPNLTLNNTVMVVAYSNEDDYVTDFIKFTPNESGWYSFEGAELNSNAYWVEMYTSEGKSLNDAYYFLSENGLNLYLDAGKDYYLRFEPWLGPEEKQIISVKESTFPALLDSESLSIPFWGAYGWDAEFISCKYIKFVPSQTGLYTFKGELSEVYDWEVYEYLSEEQKQDPFSWYGTRFGLFDGKGNEIEPESLQQEYALTGGQEYYLGVSTFLSGLYTFNVNHVGTVKLTAPELKLLTTGDLYGESGFDISWSSVAGAASYTVKVLNSAGNVAYIDSVSYTDSGYTISHLPAGTYSVSVYGVSSSGEEGPSSNVLTVNLLDGVAPCEEHKYTSAGGDICTVCGFKYEAELVPYDKTMYAAIDNAAVRNAPYSKSGSIVDRLDKGEAVEVTHYFLNSVGNKWYLTEDGNYIYSERLTTKGPKTYTMKFVANGSGVTNLPEDVEVQENIRHKIPGKMSGAPERSGYTFLGYSTNKNATEAEYVIGQGVEMTKDITLYAVWGENPEETNITAEELKNVRGEYQRPNHCTSSATATLIRRKQADLGKDVTFTYEDVRMSGNTELTKGDIDNGKLGSKFCYKPTKGYRALYSGEDSTTYITKGVSLSNVGQSNADRLETLKSLLATHDEGVVIYVDHGETNHAIVVSRYDEANNQFYAYDPAGTGRIDIPNEDDETCYIEMPIEKTWLCKTFYKGDIETMLGSLTPVASDICIWYIVNEED